ncbi:hypothetical protein GE061_002873 [Apolygus lucorum]|uniref:Cytosol aminopeptidase n=1 Tax=Apolygus lucorum TaxID=248454 RepID=A0A8S9X870_APOLU|nr:hypothetical protein GE061_002873 [Apolygus lucorum]
MSLCKSKFGAFSKNLLAKYTVCPQNRVRCGTTEVVGLVLGAYLADNDPTSDVTLTKSAKAFDDRVNGRLCEMIYASGQPPKKGEIRTFYGLDKSFNAVAVIGMGDECVSYDKREMMDEAKELIRCTAGLGVRTLQDNNRMDIVFVESFGHAESAAEGAAMAAWVYQDLKSDDSQMKIPKLELYLDCNYTAWQIGLQKAAAQNLTRQLTETPANRLTPLAFAQMAVDVLGKSNINVDVKMKRWAEMKGLGAFLAASRGPNTKTNPQHIDSVLIGKGVTFDSGGLCLKESKDLKFGKTNMCGAAMAVAVLRAVSALQLPLNVRCILPLFENLPSACAYHPGDIITTTNGKTVVVENTDFDGRLSLVDAIAYACHYDPRFIVDVGVMNKECGEALGQAATVAFSNSDSLFEQMRAAGEHTGDRLWRFPLWEYYTLEASYTTDMQSVTKSETADATNPNESYGAPCTCAAFLHEFVPPGKHWIHLDTCGVARSDGTTWQYLRRGSSGRPTRTLVEFFASLACHRK